MAWIANQLVGWAINVFASLTLQLGFSGGHLRLELGDSRVCLRLGVLGSLLCFG
jgi:hypothetical protein